MSSQIRLAVMGGLGRVGQQIRDLAQKDPDFLQTAIIHHPVDQKIPSLQDGIPVLKGIQDLDPQSVDVIVDFSLPQGFLNLATWCGEHRVKFVSGTTGFSEEGVKALNKACQTVPCLWSPNMSLGVNLMMKIIPLLKSLSHYDLQIVEAHHRHKKDKPSGTALLLQDYLKSYVKSDIPDVLSLRGGGIYSDHELWCMGEEEVIKISHVTLNARIFARGALMASKWLVQQTTPGKYTFRDVIK